MKIEITKNELEEILNNGLEKLKELALEKNPKILNREKRWADFGEIQGYYIDAHSEIFDIYENTSIQSMKNTYPTKKEAEMALAMCQLLQWRDKANGCKIEEWCDWSNTDQDKWSIKRNCNKVFVSPTSYIYHPLVFKSEKIAEQFYKDHKTLIDKAFGL